MKQNLLIVGAGIYGLIAKDIAVDMACFDKIGFIDDNAKTAMDGSAVLGTVADMNTLQQQYDAVVVAIGNPEVRLKILAYVEANTSYKTVSLIAPQAFVSSAASVAPGCIVEPMAVVHARSVLETGAVVSAGAVVNHGGHLLPGAHADCNATVAGFATVAANTKVKSNTYFE